MFQLTQKEAGNLKSQTVTSSWGGRRKLPSAFTEHGVAMLAGVLRSGRAVQMRIGVIRAFVRMRQVIENNKDIGIHVEKLERSHDRRHPPRRCRSCGHRFFRPRLWMQEPEG